MINEIGSEFQFESFDKGYFNNPLMKIDNYILTFSGRTAIELVLQNESSMKKVLLPSYCCDSMIEPFRTAGVDVDFYTVYFDDGLKSDVNSDLNVDCILLCNYFGFRQIMPDLSEFIAHGGIVIEDITHSFYSEQQFHEQSHYLVASIRKWEAILCGGYCASMKREISAIPEHTPDEDFLRQKWRAMLLKSQYLAGNMDIEKSKFLRIYYETNEWIAENYAGLIMDEYSKNYLEHVDYVVHRQKRIKNAKILYEGLKNHPDIEFLFPIACMDCPLFVPIVVKNGKRDAIRRLLIENSIYCPVHWTHPKAECESNLYDLELSLICDHRYNEMDMKRIVHVLNNER